MKHFLFYDLPLEKQAALSVITLYDVVTEKGIPSLPHAWEFPNFRGYTEEHKSSVPYLDVRFHRDSGKPFERDNALLFSVYINNLDSVGKPMYDDFSLTFNYFLRNKVSATYHCENSKSLNVSVLSSFIAENFTRENQYNIVHGLAEAITTIFRYNYAFPRRRHLTGVKYGLLRAKSAVEKLIVDTTLFIESVRDISVVDYNPNLVQIEWGEPFPKTIQFLSRPLNGSETIEDFVSMEFGYGLTKKHFKFNPIAFRDSLEFYSVMRPDADVDKVVELFGQFLDLLVSQDSFMTPNRVHSKEVTYFLHSLEEVVFDFGYILNFLNLNYVFFKDQTRALDVVYCSFY